MMKRFTAPAIVLLVLAIAGLYLKSSMATSFHANPKGHLIYTDEHNLANSGYDVVSYFTEHKAMMGTAALSTAHNGAIWQFSSAQNQQLFEQNPDKYLPQFGGFCAWGVAAKGGLFPVDPHVWTVADGKLYLNLNEEVQQQWFAQQKQFISSGMKKWPDVMGQHQAQ